MLESHYLILYNKIRWHVSQSQYINSYKNLNNSKPTNTLLWNLLYQFLKTKTSKGLILQKGEEMVLNFRDKAWIFVGILCCSSLIVSVKATVTYDRKAVIINGQRRILLSGSIHYPRSTPEVFFKMFIYIENNIFFC